MKYSNKKSQFIKKTGGYFGMNVIIQSPKYIIPFNLGALPFEPKLKILVFVSKNIL